MVIPDLQMKLWAPVQSYFSYRGWDFALLQLGTEIIVIFVLSSEKGMLHILRLPLMPGTQRTTHPNYAFEHMVLKQLFSMKCGIRKCHILLNLTSC